MDKEDVMELMQTAFALDSIALDEAVKIIVYVHNNPLELEEEISDYNNFIKTALNIAEDKKLKLLEKHPKKENNQKYISQKQKWDKAFKDFTLISRAVYRASGKQPINLNL